MKKIIPVVTCFNNNYVIPASVAFLSMLENASSDYFYILYVLHSDISEEHQQTLISIINKFNNANIEFINMNNKFDDLFKKTTTKGHYSKEMYYKLLTPSLLPQHDYIIITDVDVVFTGDISEEFIKFENDKENYMAATRAAIKKGSWLEQLIIKVYSDYTEEERKMLLNGAGYLIFNLKKMREDNCQEKFLEYTKKNLKRLKQPEQDTINAICYSKIKFLPLKSLVCTYLYDMYKNDADFKKDLWYSKEDIEEGLNNPIQLHYATNVKPWNVPTITKAELWYKYLLKTPFWNVVMQNIYEHVPDNNYFLFNFIKVLKIKNGKFKLFKFFTLKMK